MISALIRELLPDPLVKVDAPSTAEVTLLRQSVEGEERLNVHLLHYVPQRLTPNLDLVTDIIPLHDVGVTVKVASCPQRTNLAPQNVELPFTWEGTYVSCRIPRSNGHQILCVVM